MKKSRQSGDRGFTLVELMGAVVISMIVILLLYEIFNKVQSVFVKSRNRAISMELGRLAMDMLVEDFRTLGAAKLYDDTGEVPNIDWGYDSWNSQENYGKVTPPDQNDGSHPRKVIATHPTGLGRQSHVLLPSVSGIPETTGKNPFIDTVRWKRVSAMSEPDRYSLIGVVDPVGYLSPVRPYYIEAIEEDGVLLVENPIGPTTNDIIKFPNSPDRWRVDAAQQRRFTIENADTAPLNPKRVYVDMELMKNNHLREEQFQVMSQELYRHHCRFFTNDNGWRFVDYTFGGRENYMRITPASPVGALWVYRSRPMPRSGLVAERKDHKALILHDDWAALKLVEPVGYARVVDGVVHFRVRAVSPKDPAKASASPADSFYTGSLVPSYVMVELAVAEPKLVLELEEGIEQQMEGEPELERYHAKLKFLSKNLDRVYFFKQLIRIQQ